MKKLGIILMACALIMGTAQCKKNDEINKPENSGESVYITLNVGGSTRAEVVPGDDIAPVYYAEGDMIHVVSDGKYIGTLTYNGSNFDGDITNPTEGQPLHFYFFGNVTPNESLVVGETSTCSVVISDQTTSHPVISYAPSTQNYSVGTTNYTATLLNKCALVKFNVTTVSENATCITGMSNKVAVDFETNDFAYSQEDDGIITLSAGEGEKWVILLPQDEMSQTEAHSADELYTGTCASIPAIAENDYQVNGITVTISHPMGAINGLFTINANGDQVYFSQGNLQYQASTNTWRFAEHQWDYVGEANSNVSSTYYGWIDLFGWGTSGYHDSSDPYNVNYQPWSTSYDLIDETYNRYGYGPSTNMFSPNLNGSSSNYDWGVFNPIFNGGNQVGLWRTLTKEEWVYVFNTRTTNSGFRYAKAIVNNVNGVVLFPDNYTQPLGVESPNYFNITWARFNSNNWSDSAWMSMEAAGAVFLPAAGARGSTYNNPIVINYVGDCGYYWFASFKNSQYSYGMWLYNSDVSITDYGNYRCRGSSVRLIHDY